MPKGVQVRVLSLGVWRHIRRRIPLAYEHGYWAAVFPLGMYAVCTQRLIDVLELQFLRPIFIAFAWISVAAWLATFAGLLVALWNRYAGAADGIGHRHTYCIPRAYGRETYEFRRRLLAAMLLTCDSQAGAIGNGCERYLAMTCQCLQ